MLATIMPCSSTSTGFHVVLHFTLHAGRLRYILLEFVCWQVRG